MRVVITRGDDSFEVESSSGDYFADFLRILASGIRLICPDIDREIIDAIEKPRMMDVI